MIRRQLILAVLAAGVLAAGSATAAPRVLWGTCNGPTAKLESTELLSGDAGERLLREYGGLEAGRIAANATGLPARFGQAVTLITNVGVVAGKVTGMVVRSGASSVWLALEVQPAGAGKDAAFPPGLGGDCLAFLDGAPKNAKAVLHGVTLGQAAEKADEARDRLWAGLKARGAARARAVMDRLRPTWDAFRKWEPRLPAPQQALEALSLEDSDPEYGGIAALVTTDGSGTVLQVLHAPSAARTTYRLLAAVDLDGRGDEALVVRTEFYEGGGVELWRWDGRAWTATVMQSDGA